MVATSELITTKRGLRLECETEDDVITKALRERGDWEEGVGEAIDAYLASREPKPFIWTATADAILAALDKTIGQKTVTYDFARLMEGADELSCSAFGDAMIARM